MRVMGDVWDLPLSPRNEEAARENHEFVLPFYPRRCQGILIGESREGEEMHTTHRLTLHLPPLLPLDIFPLLLYIQLYTFEALRRDLEIRLCWYFPATPHEALA